MPQTIRTMTDGRLAYHRAAADAEFWDARWSDRLTHDHFAGHLAGGLGRFEELFTRWLPKHGRILEAGCGAAEYVVSLRARGYDAVGVDWGEKTIQGLHGLFPDLPVSVGDVSALDVPDGAFAGYISLGVMEHREQGPEPFLHEALRVLEPGGIAMISVPSLHPLRRLKARLGLYRGDPAGLPFYQYAYPPERFEAHARAAGFEVLHRQPYDGFKGIKDELPALEPLLRRIRKTRGGKRRMERSRFGHMMMHVCRKPGATP